MKINVFGAVIIITLCFFQPVQSQQKITNRDLKALYSLMSGFFSSEEQSKQDSAFFDIRLHMKPIWKSRKGEYWLYVEQAMASVLDKPYRQRVYNLKIENDTTIASLVYSFKGNALAYSGEWKKDKPLEGLQLDSLEARQGCIIYLHKTAANQFDGSTHKSDCSSNLRGASYATSEAHIRKDGMLTWDRGYDNKDKQVWGAVKGGYKFKKIGK
jgi:hypothetical protein